MGKIVNKKLLTIVGGGVVAAGVVTESIVSKIRYNAYFKHLAKDAEEMHNQLMGYSDSLARACAAHSTEVNDQISSSIALIDDNTAKLVECADHIRGIETRMTEYENRLSALESKVKEG